MYDTYCTYTMSNSRVSSLAWAARIEPNVQRRHVCIYLFVNNLWARVSGIIIYVELSRCEYWHQYREDETTYICIPSRDQNYCGIGAVLQGRLLQLFPALLTDSCLLFTKISSHRLQFFYQKSWQGGPLVGQNYNDDIQSRHNFLIFALFGKMAHFVLVIIR